MRFKYLVTPGYISGSDGERHYITAVSLIGLYGVPAGECAIMSDRLFLATSEQWRASLIQLTVRPEGGYREHLARLQGPKPLKPTNQRV